ncbi:cell envelope-related function transcriptional attenuator common domain-containing protein [Rhodococcoides kyotonense]|uniref:Cell envelope-related function transcriptional attenuator common domain-containing protein n=1 Tax=Rhodococcoides kyotonense TaxID=398843 RepID=A0A239GTW7_9NOCA|nr:cell envelope-related function transcriptional attenuator common domain-containing protein [Rhodococcus kyotonensis]
MVAVSSLIVSGAGWAVYREATTGLTTSNALADLPDNDPAQNGEDTNILLIGLDSRKDMDGNDLPASFVTDALHAGDSDVGGYNTNTLLLLHLPGDGSRAKAISIPRDDYVDVPGYGMRKIKEAYGLAKADADAQLMEDGVTDQAVRERQAREEGRRSTLTAVQQLLHVPIDHFAEVNLLGFYDIASAVGPIQVCLNDAVDDDYSGARFPAGIQTLDASQALSFVRQRHGLVDGDLDRTKRQQAFVAGVMSKLKESGILGNLGELRALVAGTKQDIVVDNALDPVSLVSQAGSIVDGDIDFFTLPVEGYETVDGQDVNIVDVDRLRAETARILDPAPAPLPAQADTVLPEEIPSPDAAIPDGVRVDGGIPCVD